MLRYGIPWARQVCAWRPRARCPMRIRIGQIPLKRPIRAWTMWRRCFVPTHFVVFGYNGTDVGFVSDYAVDEPRLVDLQIFPAGTATTMSSGRE